MVISIFKFLADYYGIALDAGIELTHAIAKKKFGSLKGCPFKYAESNPDLVNTGRIIYVVDAHNDIVPYICPECIKTAAYDCGYTEELEEKEEINKQTFLAQLSSMPTYIVHELLSKYKYQPSFYKLIKKELLNRGAYENKLYKLRRELDKIELDRGDCNDKYQRRRKIKCKKS